MLYYILAGMLIPGEHNTTNRLETNTGTRVVRVTVQTQRDVHGVYNIIILCTHKKKKE